MKPLNRKDFLKLSAGGTAGLTALFVGPKLAPGASPASAANGRLRIDVAGDLSTFDAVRAPAGGDPFPTGPFYVEGPIFPGGTLNPDGTIPGGASSIGLFRCWGWLFNGATGTGVVSQSYELDGRGDIQVQGVEDGNRAVTGGTGDFRGVRGEGFASPINPAVLAFGMAFDLTGARA